MYAASQLVVQITYKNTSTLQEKDSDLAHDHVIECSHSASISF